MKKLLLLAITCIVVEQTKFQGQYLTTCKAVADEVSQVILPEKVVTGMIVSYKPVKLGEEVAFGSIESINSALDKQSQN